MNEEPNRDGFLPDGPLADNASNGEPHDERSLVTAYALGEVNEQERAEIEGRLRDSADDRLACDELSRLGKLLRKVIEESPLPDRSPTLREAVLAELENPSAEPPLRLLERFPRRRFWLPLSLAASLAIICGTLVALTKTKHAQRTVADRDTITVAPSTTDEIADLSDALNEVPVEQESESVGVFGRLPGTEPTSTDHYGLMPESELKAASPGEAVLELSVQEVAGGTEGNRPTTHLSKLAGTPGQLPGRVGGTVAPEELKQRLWQDSGLPVSGGGGAAHPSTAQQSTRSSSGSMMMGRGDMGGGGQRGRAQDRIGVPYDREGGAETTTGVQGKSQARGAGERDAQADLAAAKAEYAYRSKQYERIHTLVAEKAVDEKLVEEARLGRDAAKARLDAATLASASALAPASTGESARYFAYTPNAESYAPLIENPFRKPTEYPLSTFSIDVDTASYTNVRRFLSSRAMPPPDAVRVEELINYFQYSYPQPEGDVPFSITTDVADCPWNAEHRLLRVGLKGREVPADARPASNLVFLLDVSGSMEAPNKLPLVKEAMYLLTDKLTENDRVAIVVYAGNSGLVLPPTNGTNQAAIRGAIAQLVASGSTNGGQGLQMAYDTAQSQFIKGGTNRVILATDGDFNVGIVDQSDLVKLIEEKAKSGVYLSALGFGVGNLKDGTLEKLADKGNGNYAYIDTLAEARRVLVEQLSGTLVTIAKDVKLQIEFNPAQAAEYRLIGYDDRLLPPQDFHDDRKDAGEIGAGHTVTALYEIVPAERAAANAEEPLKYQRSEHFTPAAKSDELATIKLRYKDPEASNSRLVEHIVNDRRPQQPMASGDFAFVAAVAQFGMLLRDSPYRGAASYQAVLALAEQGLAGDASGYRSEFIELVRQARDISGKE